jgi:hypothetical protein
MSPNNNPTPQPPLWQQPAQPPLYPPPVAPPQTEPQLPEPQDPGQDFSNTTAPSSRRPVIILIIIVVLLALIAAVSYITLANRKASDNSDKTVATQTVPMTNLKSASIVPPPDLSRYQANASNSESNMRYLSTDGACSLQIGVASASDMPGKDFDEIVKNHAQKLRADGATVQGPSSGTAIKMKSAADENVSYTLPSVVITASNNGTYIGSHFSAAILKDGSRLYAERRCETKDTLVAPARLDELDTDAQNSTIIIT